MKYLKLLGLSLFLLLTGCAAALVAGSTAGAVVYDGRGLVILERDARIHHLINTHIAKDPRFKNSHIVVTSFGQAVLLVGQTPAASLKILAEKIARRTPRVLRVYNEITLAYPTEFTIRANDAWITSKIRSEMLFRRGLESGSIHIVTENSVVYLMGVVSKEQAFLAMDVARKVHGVHRVVKVFKYRN